MHPSQIFFGLLMSFIAGVALGSFFVVSQVVLLILIVLGIILILFTWRRNWYGVAVGFMLLLFAFGAVRTNSYQADHNILAKLAKQNAENIADQSRYKSKVLLYGYIDKEPKIKDDKQQIIFFAHALETESVGLQLNEHVLITANLYPRFDYGQIVKVEGELQLPQNLDDSGFDYKKYLAKDDIFTVMFQPHIASANFDLSRSERVRIALLKKNFFLKHKFEQSLNKILSEPYASFVDGILLGGSAQIPDAIVEAFKRTGTSHILAVSGYNITIVVSIISSLLLLIVARPIAFWLSAIGIIIFALLTGAEASVVRAAVMGIIVLFAQREGRLYEARNALLVAAALMIASNPAILRYDIGFQLSFGATLGLIYIVPLLERYFVRLPNIFSLRETFVMTLSAQIFVLPLLLYYFKVFSLVSLPANILALPLIPYTMLLGFLTGVIGIISLPIGKFFGLGAYLLSRIVLTIIGFFSKPGWALIDLSLQPYQVLATYGFLLVLVFWAIKRRNPNK